MSRHNLSYLNVLQALSDVLPGNIFNGTFPVHVVSFRCMQIAIFDLFGCTWPEVQSSCIRNLQVTLAAYTRSLCSEAEICSYPAAEQLLGTTYRSLGSILHATGLAAMESAATGSGASINAACIKIKTDNSDNMTSHRFKRQTAFSDTSNHWRHQTCTCERTVIGAVNLVTAQTSRTSKITTP